jgi:small-conductance mechanosensitive channel
MSKKTRKIFFLSFGYILLILFLQTIYSFFYSSLPQSINKNPNAIYSLTEAFMTPYGLTVVISVIFVISIVVIALFDSY